MHSTMSERLVRLAWGFAAGVAILVAASGPSLAAASCFSADLSDSFLLPDGRQYPAGRLTICNERSFSPVAVQTSFKVDGMPVGMAISRSASSQQTDVNDNVFMFARRSDRTLRLLAYALPDGNLTRLNTFGDPSVTVEVGEYLRRADARDRGDGSSLVWVAALR